MDKTTEEQFTDFTKRFKANVESAVPEDETFSDGSSFNRETGVVTDSAGVKNAPTNNINTSPATPTPLATPSAPASPVVNRPIVSSPEDFAQTQRDEATRIRNDEIASARGRVEDINRQFEGIIRDETQAGEGRAGSTRSRGARAGLLGSSFGAAQQAGTEKFNKQQQQFIQDQKTVQINAVFDKFDERANERIASERELAFATRDEQIANRDKFISEGKSLVGNIASQGVDFNQLDEEDLAEMKAQTGLSDLALETFYNANLPKNQQVKYDFMELADGTLLRTGDDGSAEGVGNFAKPDVVQNWKAKDIDGTMYWVTQDDEGNITDFKKFDEKDEPSELDIMQQQAEITKLMTEIEQIGVTDPVEAEKKQLELELLQQKVNQKEEADNQVAIKAGNAFQVFDDKVSLIDELIAHPGMTKVVGTFITGRLGFDPISGEAQDFSGKIKNLIGKETIDTLVALKARGGTLGALSDKERELLENSATAIGGWANDKGNRWNVKQDKFIEELEKIKASTERVRDAAKADSLSGGGNDTNFDSVWD